MIALHEAHVGDAKKFPKLAIGDFHWPGRSVIELAVLRQMRDVAGVQEKCGLLPVQLGELRDRRIFAHRLPRDLRLERRVKILAYLFACPAAFVATEQDA